VEGKLAINHCRRLRSELLPCSFSTPTVASSSFSPSILSSSVSTSLFSSLRLLERVLRGGEMAAAASSGEESASEDDEEADS
jgi:hypothetical protein